ANARDALATITAASHEALQEMRMILGVLRETENGSAPLEPTPDLSAVDTMIEHARSTGLDVSFEVEGERPPRVPEAVQVAAVRIRGESLANARRHAPGAAASVRLSYGVDGLRLAIENDARNANGRGAPGIGITGMRERAAALGGTLRAQRSGERFRVDVELPYRLDA